MTDPADDTPIPAGQSAAPPSPPAAAQAGETDMTESGISGTGMEVIRRFWATLPNAPGVYRMIDAAGEVLYVGKAKSLKNRVGSYARGQGHSNRIIRMIADTAQMEFVTTGTESEALLLEANLIKQLRPRYNVLLRDDKSLPYILVTEDERGGAAHQASRCAQPQGALFRPLRQRLGGQPHHDGPATRLPPAHLLGFLFRQPLAPLPALPDQALRRAPVPARSRRRITRRSPARRWISSPARVHG